MSPVRRTSNGVTHLLVGQSILPHGHSVLHGHGPVELGVLLCGYRNVLEMFTLVGADKVWLAGSPFSLKHYFGNIKLNKKRRNCCFKLNHVPNKLKCVTN